MSKYRFGIFFFFFFGGGGGGGVTKIFLAMPDIPDFFDFFWGGGGQTVDARSKPIYQEKNESTPTPPPLNTPSLGGDLHGTGVLVCIHFRGNVIWPLYHNSPDTHSPYQTTDSC